MTGWFGGGQGDLHLMDYAGRSPLLTCFVIFLSFEVTTKCCCVAGGRIMFYEQNVGANSDLAI